MWLVSFASSMAFLISLLVVLLAIAIPFILIGVASPPVGLILGIPVGLVVLILAVSAYSTYDHSLWTLMYRDLTGLSAVAPQAVAATPGERVPQNHWHTAEGGSDEEA